MKKILFILLAICSAFIFSCNKDENNDPANSSSEITINVIGQIKDENGAGLSNVTVELGNKTATTNNYGIFLLEKVHVNNC